MPGDELIGDVVQVIADKFGLRADPQHVVASSLDQRGFPASRDGAERVPCMAGDETEPRRLDPELLLDMGVCLARWLMVFDAVRAEPSLEEIDDAALSGGSSRATEIARCGFPAVYAHEQPG